jgi:4-hydroxybenzoate polyprenyltransferase
LIRAAGKRAQRVRGVGRASFQLLRLVKFEHSVFALPFALAGAFWAAGGVPSGWAILWIVAAAVGARNFAFALNRLADKEWDARNPRTQDRLSFRHLLEGKAVWVFMALSLGLFVAAAALLNRLTLRLSPFVIAVIVFYSFSKRWTWTSHGLLGFALACAPAGAWIAVRGDLTPVPLWLALGVTAWVAGFDVIYACLDVDFDRSEGLHSIPCRFGVRTGLWISAGLHLAAALSFFAAGRIGGAGPIYWIAWAGGTVLLAYEHYLVRPDDLSRLNVSFFNLNAWFSVVMGLGAVADSVFRPLT